MARLINWEEVNIGPKGERYHLAMDDRELETLKASFEFLETNEHNLSIKKALGIEE